MIWLDVIALAGPMIILLGSKAFYSKLFGGALLTHYLSAIVSEFGGGAIQPMTRLFAFVIIFMGTAFCLLLFFTQSGRDKEGTEV